MIIQMAIYVHSGQYVGNGNNFCNVFVESFWAYYIKMPTIFFESIH